MFRLETELSLEKSRGTANQYQSMHYGDRLNHFLTFVLKGKEGKRNAGGRTRTDMVLLPRDFESRASTSFTTPAMGESIDQLPMTVKVG